MADAASDASMVRLGHRLSVARLYSDRIGRCKPVLIGGALVMLAAAIAAVYLSETVLPRYLVPLMLSIGSGAAMTPFTMIKEANPPEVKGTASGVMNFLVFLTNGVISTFVSRLMTPALDAPLSLQEFPEGFLPLIVGIVVAIALSIVIREIGVGHSSPESERAASPAKGTSRIPA
jgi:MFS family permease